MKHIRVWMSVICFIVTGIAFAAVSPVPMLEDSASKILETLKKNQAQLKSNHQITYQAISRYLLPHVDVYGMSRSVLGRQVWTNATEAEKNEFTKAFTQLVIRTYAAPIAEYSGETVKFLPLRGSLDSRFLRVNSIITRPNGQTIPLSYNLVSKNGEWKVYDLSVEGVSLLQSFKSQFSEMLQNKSIKDLIDQIKQTKKMA